MEANYCLLNRRSIRKYKEEQISDELLDAVVEAGTYAPTAMGTQSPLIVAVQNKEDIELMSKLNAQTVGLESDPFYGAPTVIVVFADSTMGYSVKDATLVMGNLLNAAFANDLASCWIDRAKETFELEEGKALMKKWGVDEKYVGVGNCILGYPNCGPRTAKPRKENYIIKIK